MHLIDSPTGVKVAGNPRFPVNEGGLCVKGWSAAATLRHPERLRAPLVRDESGQLVPTTWTAAIEHVAQGVRHVQQTYGRDAVAVFGGGSLTNEKAYWLGKFARVALGTPNIDYNGRFCMSSAAAAAFQAFGIDRGLPFPLADIPHAQVILLAGSNVAETMPPVMRYFEAQQENGGKLIVVDPRRTPTALWAASHVHLRPGTDLAFVNGVLHVLIAENLIDEAYIRTRTEGFEELRRIAAAYWPELVERITGVPEAAIVHTARTLGTAGRVMVLTARGPEQQAQGVNNALGYINLALALGAVGREHSGFGTLTGQGNGQGGREHGQKADQLPGYRRIDDPHARQHVADVWGVPVDSLPTAGRPAVELIGRMGEDVRALFVMGSNLAVSAPDGGNVEARLKALDFLVVCDFFLSETASLADVVLPSAQWAEEEGTMTNLEGRVILRQRAMGPPAGVRTDLEIISLVAEALGKRPFFLSHTPRDVFAELTRASAGGLADYSGITYERIEAEAGVFWPCPAPDEQAHPGTPRLFAETFPTPNGRARFRAVRHASLVDDRDDTYPLFLTTGRVLAQYQSGTQTHRVDELEEVAPEPLAEIHPTTARLYGVAAGERATLMTRRGAATFLVKLTPTVREDTVFVPFHWGGAQSINRLTTSATDPVSGMPQFKVCALRLMPAASTEESAS
jgi:assimilatory nitrate reductase catalytic subunit